VYEVDDAHRLHSADDVSAGSLGVGLVEVGP
jgi:hypothetical protein